jgi:hypothetical protein
LDAFLDPFLDAFLELFLEPFLDLDCALTATTSAVLEEREALDFALDPLFFFGRPAFFLPPACEHGSFVNTFSFAIINILIIDNNFL